MIDLYAAGTSNGIRARIALEECALPYTLHRIALDRGEQRTPQFLALNPNAAIPVIVDSDGPGGQKITLTQSSAILVYCAEKSGKYLPKEGVARTAVWEALMNASTDVTPTLGSIFAITRSPSPHAPSADLFRARFRQYLQVWDAKLAKQRCAAGDEVTIADFSLYAGYARAKNAEPALCEGFAHLGRWAEAMASRPATQRALAF